jgi:hypothetical protein
MSTAARRTSRGGFCVRDENGKTERRNGIRLRSPKAKRFYRTPGRLRRRRAGSTKNPDCSGEFAVFLDLDLNDGVRHVLYFSPFAATLCTELIASSEGKACSLPANPGPSFGMAYGNSKEAWALVERDKPQKEDNEISDDLDAAQATAATEARYIKIDPRDFICSPFERCPITGRSFLKEIKSERT